LSGANRFRKAGRSLPVYSEQPMRVGSGTGAPAARLNTEDVTQHAREELMVDKIAVAPPNAEGEDRQAWCGAVAQHCDVRIFAPDRERVIAQFGVAALDKDLPERVLYEEHECRTDVSDYVGSTRLLARG